MNEGLIFTVEISCRSRKHGGNLYKTFRVFRWIDITALRRAVCLPYIRAILCQNVNEYDTHILPV
jgi:hypothetical protein